MFFLFFVEKTYMVHVKLLLIPSLFLVSGCFFHSTISSIGPVPSPEAIQELTKLSSIELTSGSSGYTRTPVSGYLVKQSAGLIINRQYANTPNGYKVYLNSTGRLTSEEQ